MSRKKTDHNLDSLIGQLKDTTLVNNHIQKESVKEELVAPENIEQFVVKNSSELITQSLDVMNNVKDYIMASGDPDSISALSELINASSKAIESLNKIVIQNKRSATSIATKTMDIQSKHVIEDKRNENALIATREEMFNKILNEAKTIEVKEAEVSLDDPDLQTEPQDNQN